MYAQVLVEYNAKAVDKTFTYKIKEELLPILKVGMKVKIPFANKLINGFVIEINDTYSSDYDVKEIDSIINAELVLNSELLDLGKYLQEQTLCSLITAYQTMLPSSLKVKTNDTNYQKYDTFIELNKSEEDILCFIEMNKRSRKQVEILQSLLEDKKILKTIIAGSSLNILLDKDIVKETKEKKYRLNYGEVYQTTKKNLTDEQEVVFNNIKANLNTHNTYLIHGVTGSGKTEVYLRLIDEVISKNKTAIVLVPEISLTTQIVERFYERFGNSVAVFHSALSDGEKYDEYLKMLNGEVSIVVGARSAIFSPLKNLGIIIIDEEHSDNYKQDSTPKYHATSMALFRAKYNNIPLVLGSATPSLETMARAKKRVYTLLEMKKRVGTSTLPISTIIDMAPEMKKRNMIFSDLLKDKIINRLEKKEQVILLLNRRGFSTIITCQACGFTYKCPHCDISLTYHKTSNNIRCHYCGYTVLKPNACPECQENALNYYGLGTEKLEESIKTTFPTAKVVRMDADTTQNKGTHKKIIEDFQNHKYDILLGTQMISKGLDFPLVTLVGIINADSTLNIPDFRSSERTFELLLQASGRAGRSDKSGEVIIQTFNPDAYALRCVQKNDYEAFYKYEMDIRKKLGYPPYYYLISIKIISKDYDQASLEVKKVAAYLKNNLEKETIILGPTTAAMFKVNNNYRFQIIIKYRFDKNIIPTLNSLNALFATNKSVYIDIDINPLRI